MIRRVAMLVLLGCVAPAVALADGVRVIPLTAAEVPALLKPPEHGTRIIMLWALSCGYCEPNMQALAKLQRARPQAVQLVTVATDFAAGARPVIAARLDAAGMQDYPARAYATGATARMNYLIDPTWGGEMPRTLVIRSGGQRIAISGKLTPVQLRGLQPRTVPVARGEIRRRFEPAHLRRRITAVRTIAPESGFNLASR